MTTATAAAQPADGSKGTDPCAETRKQCESLLLQAQSIISDQEEVITLQKEQLSILSQNMQTAARGWEEEKRRADAWYRDPFLVIPTAILVGFIASEALRARGK